MRTKEMEKLKKRGGLEAFFGFTVSVTLKTWAYMRRLKTTIK